MFKKLIYPLFILGIAYLLFYSDEANSIIAGISVFLIGMVFMEDGFKLFSGGMLERVLEKTTNTIPRAVGTGFLATAIVQSSSLLTIIVISFLSAELISLSGAIGVVFGANIGTTTTAWIVSAFGVKIHIAHYAMPMLIFGVIFRFNNSKIYKGIGSVLIGLGFVFLGIGYMKEGFEVMKDGLDLAQFAMDGYLGVLVYTLLGIIATVIIQSSSATMAIIITALATGQIEYVNALALAIGANVGTTVTAILGSLSSNANGKRLAVAHFIFNIITGLVAIIFLYQLKEIVDFLSQEVGISQADYAMKLALFHTIFNIIGVLLVTPFTHKLVDFLEGLFLEEQKDILRAKYLDNVIIEVPEAAIKAIEKESSYLYDIVAKGLTHAMSLHRDDILSKEDKNITSIVQKSIKHIDVDTKDFYDKKVKYLYSDIMNFASFAQENMDSDQVNKVYYLKVACRKIVENIKDIGEVQKNFNKYMNSNNSDIKNEYDLMRVDMARTLNIIYLLRNTDDDFDVLTKLKLLQDDLKQNDVVKNGRIDELIRTHKIDSKMATSIINDSAYTYDISKRLIDIATTLWIADKEIKKLGDEL